MTLTRALIFIAICATPFMFSGCETGDDRQISSAQSCLDTATDAATADVCVAKIEGNESADAYLIRCSANFIAQGIRGTTLATAFQSLKDDSGGTGAQGSATAKMAAYLVFKDTSAAHNADTTVGYCQTSGVASMFKLATAVQLVSTIANLGGANIDLTQSPAQIAAAYQTAVTNLIAGGAANQATIGNLAKSASATLCTTGSTYESTDVCASLEKSISSGTSSADIGAQLLALLHH